MNGVFLDKPSTPGWNMAADSWLAHEAPLACGEMILRLYSWSPPGFTIGRNQSWERALNLAALRPGEMAIRRVTGGRAIYHDSSEMTYALCLRPNTTESEPPEDTEENSEGGEARILTLSPQRARLYSQLVGEAICDFLRSLGMPATLGRSRRFRPGKQRADSQSPHCFESLVRYEITSAGRKVAAGAQRIIGSRFFQHGSIKIGGYSESLALFGGDSSLIGEKVNDKASALEGSAGTRSDHSGAQGSPGWQSALRKSFESVFERQLPILDLSSADKRRIRELETSLDVHLPQTEEETAMAAEGALVG